MGKSEAYLLCFISLEHFINIKLGNEMDKRSSRYICSCLRWHSPQVIVLLTTDLALCGFHLTNPITNGFVTPKQSFASSAEAEDLGRSSFSFSYHCSHLIGTSHRLFNLLIEPNGV